MSWTLVVRMELVVGMSWRELVVGNALVVWNELDIGSPERIGSV